MSTLRFALLAQALLVRVLLAERITDADGQLFTDDPIVKVTDLVKGEDNICGGPEIWREVTKDQTATGVQNINWAKIDAIAEDYLQTQHTRIKTIHHSLDTLASQIGEIEQSREKVRDIGKQELVDLITAGAKPLGDVAEARRTNCGSPQVRPRAPRGGYRKAVADFEPEAEKLFSCCIKVGEAPFLEVCKETLTCEDGEASCYCDRLCQQFRDVAQKVSDKNIGEHAGNTDELVRSRNALQEELAMRQGEISECEDARKQLNTFGEQIGVLKSKVNERFDILQKAEDALYDAEEELADLEDDLKEQEEAETAALAVLQEATGVFDAATAAVKKLQEDEKDLLGRVLSSSASLAAARQELDNAMAADKTMNGLRELVSTTIMKMEMYFDQAVQSPVRALGIKEDLDLSTVFVGAPEEMTSAGSMREAVDNMARYCSEDGEEAIKAMRSKVDLSPLCSFGTAEDMKGDINAAVAEGLRVVKERIEQVKGWLNPYRGQSKMNDKVAAEYVKEGEPAGLRRIVSSYGNFGIYKKYLKQWKRQGSFLSLLQALGDAATKLQAQVDEMAASLTDLKEQLEKTTTSRHAAEVELEKASQDKNLAEEKQETLKKTIVALRENGEKMTRDIEELEAQVREAHKKYHEAVEKIKDAGKEATSFLQALEQSEKLDELESDAAKAHDHMLFLRIEADRAARAYSLAEAKAADAREEQASK
mmetsp:Transcript_108430/g.288613  ORF Transcript_108430/g.288613 Transcript_108430/m.288613 type:complete len:709 (-) Transcript_108430:143-2269(-)